MAVFPKQLVSGPVTGTITNQHMDGLSVTFDFEITELRLTRAEFDRMSTEDQDQYRPIVQFVDVSEVPARWGQ